MREYSEYQKGVIKRYYEQRDTIAVSKLAEIVSNLYLEKSKAKVTRLWESAYKQLLAAGIPINRACVVVEDRDLGALAKIVQQIT